MDGFQIFTLMIICLLFFGFLFWKLSEAEKREKEKKELRKGLLTVRFFNKSATSIVLGLDQQSYAVTFEVVEIEKSSDGQWSRLEYGDGWGAPLNLIQQARVTIAPEWCLSNEITWITKKVENV